MDVQVIDAKVPAHHCRVGSDHPLHVRQEIGLRARGRVARGQDLPGHHVAAEDEGTGAVSDVLELDAFHLAGCHGQARMLSLQRLHTAQFIAGHHSFPLFDQGRCLPIQRTEVADLDLEVGVIGGGQPVSPAVRLQIPLLSSRAACRPRSGRRCLVL